MNRNTFKQLKGPLLLGTALFSGLMASSMMSHPHRRYAHTYKPFHSPRPIILKAGWGFVTVKHGDEKIERTPATGRADTLLTPEGAPKWDWKACDMRHKPGYTKENVQQLIALYPEATHLILTLGYENVICVDGVRYQGTVPQATLTKVAGWIGNTNSHVEIVIANTEKAIEKYHQLVKNKKNKVFMAAHFTC